LVESAFALLTLALMMAGVMELGLVGFASNSVSFAAQRAARYAAVRGSGSGHAATAADIRNTALSYSTPLSAASITVTVTWTPNNNPGSTAQVAVAYSFRPALLPVSAGTLTLRSTARQTITQ
jgi:Flp pilus assembly protein TadG